jgi:hypothetical protein
MLMNPTYAVPGELLQSVTLAEARNFPVLANSMFDVCDRRTMLEHGELWLVLASWCVVPALDNRFDREVYTVRPALLLHLPTQRIFEFENMEGVKWLWRP